MKSYSETVMIQNELGLHARPASYLVKTANAFQSDIEIIKDGETVNGKSIMGIMMLAAAKGTKLVIRAEGEDSLNAVKDIVAVINNKFGEE
jgi:phosphocarrier protein